MRRFLPVLLFLLWMSLPTASAAQQADATPSPEASQPAQASSPEPGQPALDITSPTAGETVKGSIPISINLEQTGFNAWELSFAPAQNPTDTWFLLTRGTEPFSGELLRWDTTPLTDGDYSLRLRVFFSDAYRDVLVTPVNVRNYTLDTPIPLPTATASLTPRATATILPTGTATEKPPVRPTPTPLPANPAILQNDSIAEAALRGLAFSLAVFAATSLVAWLKNRLNGNK